MDDATTVPGQSTVAVTTSMKMESNPSVNDSFRSQERMSTLQVIGNQLEMEAKELFACLSTMSEALFQSSVKATDIVECCDTLDKLMIDQALERNGEKVGDGLLVTGRKVLDLRRRALEFRRYELLTKLLKQDYDAYIATAEFLSPSRIPRNALPNVQDVPLVKSVDAIKNESRDDQDATPTLKDENGKPLVADCQLDNMEFQDNALDKLLLFIFRKLVTHHTGGVTSDQPGIHGLVEQARTFMLQPGQTPEGQHEMVYKTLKSLMTPALPPFYRIFMAGIVPTQLGTPWDGKQWGPWFYAPSLTSWVTPIFFAFLVGPSHVNLRQDGEAGGLVVEKCKFLQESGCKGLCLHQCKLPAQQFFQNELGLPLSVMPNFVTQECQWSFGQEPVPPQDDPYFPTGCLSGCPSRQALAAANAGKMQGSIVDLCN